MVFGSIVGSHYGMVWYGMVWYGMPPVIAQFTEVKMFIVHTTL